MLRCSQMFLYIKLPNFVINVKVDEAVVRRLSIVSLLKRKGLG